jgi:YteA family regulatory protein
MDNSLKMYYKDLLEKQKNEIEHTLDLMKENKTAEQDLESATELSNYDNHPADIGTELYILEHNKGLKVHEEHILKDINDALSRLNADNYGKCAFCGQQIDSERLEAVPYARLCIDCEENKTLDLNDIGNRPNEERVLDAPFGRKYLNKREDDENEGLDYLNDLMKFGSSDSPQDMGGYHDYVEFYTNDYDKQGVVDDMDQFSNDDYKKQLPD